MDLFIKLFIRQKIWRLILLSFTVALIWLLIYYVSILKKDLEDRIIVNEIGSIPSITLSFGQELKESKINGILQEIQNEISIDYIRKGFKFTSRVKFEWDKSGNYVWTDFELVRIGWDLTQNIDLVVESGGKIKEIPCPTMHPENGFAIPEKFAKDLGGDIIVKRAKIKSNKSHIVDMGLPARLKEKSKLINIKGVICKKYSISTPEDNKISKAAYYVLKDKYYMKISKAYSEPLGNKFWRTLNHDAQKNIYRLYKNESIAIPSIQLWNDICGNSLQKYSSFKKFKISEQLNGNQPYKLEFMGYFQSRYADKVNGYVLLSSMDWLMQLLGKRKKAYNLIELEISIKHSYDRIIKKLKNILDKYGFNSQQVKIIPWWELADKQSVNFLKKLIQHLYWFITIMLVSGLFAFFQMSSRFVQHISTLWTIVELQGAKKIHFLFVGFCHILIMLSGGILIAFLLARFVINKYFIDPLLYKAFIDPSIALR